MEETMAGCQRLAFKDIHNFIMSLVGVDLHAKRVYSLANATQGIITSASLAVSTIGQGLAAARGLLSKHAIKQVDRLLSNAGIEVDAFFVRWVPYIVGERKSIEVAMDWTDFDADKQATIMLSLITQHGRTTSLVWLTVDKDTLKHNRNRYEHTVLVRLAEALPSDVEVLIVADRGFGDHKLYQVLTDELKFDYLIRFRGNIKVTAAEGETRSATDWVGAGGRMRILRGCAVTADGYPVGAVVCVQAKDMKAPWCLCTSLKDVKAKSLLAKYAKRWGIGVSRQRARCHVGESPTEAKRLRLRSKGGAVARKQDGGALRQHARKECARSIRLQRTVNAYVASLHVLYPVAETVDNARRQQGSTKGVRSGGPHRRGISGDMMRTTACQLERPSTPGGRNPAEETLPITVSGKWKGRRQGVGSGQTVLLMGVQQNAPGGKGPDR
jgi:hypothetical protein